MDWFGAVCHCCTVEGQVHHWLMHHFLAALGPQPHGVLFQIPGSPSRKRVVLQMVLRHFPVPSAAECWTPLDPILPSSELLRCPVAAFTLQWSSFALTGLARAGTLPWKQGAGILPHAVLGFLQSRVDKKELIYKSRRAQLLLKAAGHWPYCRGDKSSPGSCILSSCSAVLPLRPVCAQKILGEADFSFPGESHQETRRVKNEEAPKPEVKGRHLGHSEPLLGLWCPRNLKTRFL